jgi:maltose O-acetyltransferase
MKLTTGALWYFLDPLLMRVISRLNHLQLMREEVLSNENFELKAHFDSSVVFLPGAQINNYAQRERLLIGSHSHIAGQLSLNTQYGELGIGHHCFVGSGSRIWAYQQIEIGNYVLISHLVDIHDSDGHPTDARLRREHPTTLFERKHPINYRDVPALPIIIEDDVWVGFKSTILKGVRIGRGAIIAAASVVTHNVEPFTLVAGNPARIVRRLESSITA